MNFSQNALYLVECAFINRQLHIEFHGLIIDPYNNLIAIKTQQSAGNPLLEILKELSRRYLS